MASITLPTLDTSVLLNYYTARLPVSPSAATSANAATAAAKSATANDNPPWERNTAAPQEAQDEQVLSTTNFIDLSKVPKGTGGSADQKTEQDNQKLFA